MPEPIRLNPTLDVRDFAGEFQRAVMVQAPDFLTPRSAERVEAALATVAPCASALRLLITGWLRDDKPYAEQGR